MDLQFWFMFPVSVVVATTAMASGVEGATFFAPIFILLLGLSPEVAIGTGLITEVFGFASGLYAYQRKRLIDYRLGLSLLAVTVPLAVFTIPGVVIGGQIGSVTASRISQQVLERTLGLLFILVAILVAVNVSM